MSSNSSWVPNEDPQTIFLERCWLQGAVISSIAYGITVTLYFFSFHLLVREGNRRVEFKKRLPLLIYITISLILGTIFMFSLAAFTQMAFIDDRNYPGGPSAFESNMFSIPIDDAGNAAFVLSTWLSDALVVWRLKVVYQQCRIPIWVVMFFPCMMLAGSVAIGIMFFIQVSTTNAYIANNINFALPYFGLSLALNIILTIAIVLRLLFLRYRIVSVLGAKHGTVYTSVAAMIIESASLYSAVSITFLVLFIVGNPVSEVFLQSLNQIQVIATLLIVFRIAQGKGWTEGTATRVITCKGLELFELDSLHSSVVGVSSTLAGGEEILNDVSGVEI